MEIQDKAEYHPIFRGLAVQLSRQISKQTIIRLEFSGVAVYRMRECEVP